MSCSLVHQVASPPSITDRDVFRGQERKSPATWAGLLESGAGNEIRTRDIHLGKVVLYPDSGGVREVVGDAGFLVPPRDNVALAAAMNQALNLDASEKQQLVQKGRERIQECFSLDVTAEWYLKVYADTSLALEPKGHS